MAAFEEVPFISVIGDLNILEECHLEWKASYHANERLELIMINETWVDTLGRCVLSSSNRQNYIFRFDLDIEGRCIDHYKVDNDDIDTLCKNALLGDTPMKMLFQIDAKPESCPFEPPLNFTYTIQDGACSSRISSVTACSGYGKYRFQYEACPELPNSEMHGRHKYDIKAANLISKVQQTTIAGGGSIGFSADSSCNELIDLTYATTKIDYTQELLVKSQCQFPSFLVHDFNSSHKRVWTSITTGFKHHVLDTWITMSNGLNHSVLQCLEVENLGNVHTIIIYTKTLQCTSGYQCFEIKRKHKNILEIRYTSLFNSVPVTCNLLDYESIDTVVLENAEAACPFKHRHSSHPCPNYTVQFGSVHEHPLTSFSECTDISHEKFVCFGPWIEKDVTYVITKDLSSLEFYCYICLRYLNGTIFIRSYLRSACHPQSFEGREPDHIFTFMTFVRITKKRLVRNTADDIKERRNQIENERHVEAVSLFNYLHEKLKRTPLHSVRSIEKTVKLTVFRKQLRNSNQLRKMLGLMNSPGESVEFYAQPTVDQDNSVINEQFQRKLTVSYMDDGRQLIDGKVVERREPQEMWCSLLTKSAARQFEGQLVYNSKSFCDEYPTATVREEIESKLVNPEITVSPESSAIPEVENLNPANVSVIDIFDNEKICKQDESEVVAEGKSSD
ncbi:unnamed protein product [Thelazia callipaeda]|uniref:MAM domain-containing protein n=1 Tax=Thelazia callipaeda TaxID=103827 RepID=A0A0N5CZQ3_THECL|nr:unnamed protein product [Thelazia callipaeda]